MPHKNYNKVKTTLIARFMGPTWGPPGADMLAPWSFLSGDCEKVVFIHNDRFPEGTRYRNMLMPTICKVLTSHTWHWLHRTWTPPPPPLFFKKPGWNNRVSFFRGSIFFVCLQWCLLELWNITSSTSEILLHVQSYTVVVHISVVNKYNEYNWCELLSIKYCSL